MGSRAATISWCSGRRVAVQNPCRSTPHANESEGSLSSNAKWIAYTTDQTGRDEVWVASFPSGTLRRQVSVDGGVSPRWCGGENAIVYLAGDKHLTAVPFRGSPSVSTWVTDSRCSRSPIWLNSTGRWCRRRTTMPRRPIAGGSRRDEAARSAGAANQDRRELAGACWSADVLGSNCDSNENHGCRP